MQAICSKILNKMKRPPVVISGDPIDVAEAVVGFSAQAKGQVNVNFRCEDEEWSSFRSVCSFLGATVPDSARVVEPEPEPEKEADDA